MTQSELTLKIFNAFFCEGSKVQYRLWADDDSTLMEMTVRGEAFITHHDIPAVFFKEKTGYFSIEPQHLVYPPFHLCFFENEEVPEVVALSEKDTQNYSGVCEFDDDHGRCRYCNRLMPQTPLDLD